MTRVKGSGEEEDDGEAVAGCCESSAAVALYSGEELKSNGEEMDGDSPGE